MNAKFLRATFVAVSFLLSACSNRSPDAVAIDFEAEQSSVQASKDSVDFSDVTVMSENTKPRFGEKPPDSTKVLSDKSQLTTNYDGYGNMLQKRIFPDHRRISFVKAVTAADGRIEIVAYGYNGERSVLPESQYEKVLTADADSIARLAGITSDRQVKSRITAPVSKATSIPARSPSAAETNDGLPGKPTETAEPEKAQPENSPLLQD